MHKPAGEFCLSILSIRFSVDRVPRRDPLSAYFQFYRLDSVGTVTSKPLEEYILSILSIRFV